MEISYRSGQAECRTYFVFSLHHLDAGGNWSSDNFDTSISQNPFLCYILVLLGLSSFSSLPNGRSYEIFLIQQFSDSLFPYHLILSSDQLFLPQTTSYYCLLLNPIWNLFVLIIFLFRVVLHFFNSPKFILKHLFITVRSYLDLFSPVCLFLCFTSRWSFHHVFKLFLFWSCVLTPSPFTTNFISTICEPNFAIRLLTTHWSSHNQIEICCS